MAVLNGDFESVPQVVAITSISAEGKLTLKKAVRQYLGLQTGQSLFLDVREEILLSTAAIGAEVPVDKRNCVSLPGRALEKLEVAGKALVGLVQRPDAVAAKRLEIAEEAGERARLVDIETTYTLTRQVETSRLPKDLLPRLEGRYQDLGLRYDVAGFLRGKRTLPAWKARRLLGKTEQSDDALREKLIQERLEGQGEDGSWEGQVVMTARNLRELADLGMTGEDEPIHRAANWLLARPQSIHNPGMFFAADELVAEQARIVTERQSGNRLRFREMKRSEQKRVMAGDDLIRTPCGPRIMWPNALVLEALLYLGYEQHERVQAALSFMRTHDWCECGYQHGGSDWRSVEPLEMEQVEAFERACINQFRYGGIYTLKELEQADMAHQPLQLIRGARTVTPDGDEYPLQMPDHIQGCEFITTRAMSHVRDPKMRRFAEAHLWRFASRQHATSGEFAKERHGSGFPQEGILEAVARYDHPASKVIVWRSLPWIVEAQNEDGSWGQELYKDGSTLAVLSALDSVGVDRGKSAEREPDR
jgi:bifunctional DNA-binding transcriptional regulator/antitoxin component of YhaV-PrlF toxin-antitoxin module